VCVAHKEPNAKSVDHPAEILFSAIHTRNVEIPNDLIGQNYLFLTNLIYNR